jgi:monothiol glutaredoxin
MHGANFTTYNVLENEQLRQGIKDYTQWPTIPQVFFNKEFIGGCDILLEMHQNGSLVDELKKIGIDSKLAEDEDGNEAKK